MLVKPGARIEKTIISIIISMVITYMITGNTSAVAPISAVIALRESTEDSIKTGVERIVGTIVGSVLSLLYIFLFTSIFDNHNFIILTISTAILSYISLWICKNLKFSASSASNSVILIIIVLNGFLGSKGNAFTYVLIRTLETAIGIISAVMINNYYKPNINDSKEI